MSEKQGGRLRTQFDGWGKMCLLLVVIMIGALLCGCGTTESLEVTVPPGPADRVEVVFFQEPEPCACMMTGEVGTIYSMETYFKHEIASGKVTFELIYVDDKEKVDIITKYGAAWASLFINSIRGDSECIEKVTYIWYLVGDWEKLAQYVRDRVEEHLKGGSVTEE